MSLPANTSPLPVESSLIAGSVLPIQRAEELLGTLPGVISARIVAGMGGSVEEIHLLTSTEVTPKQTVRNVESALIAHLGMRVSHKKISVATSDEGQRPQRFGVTSLHLPVAASPTGAGSDDLPMSPATAGYAKEEEPTPAAAGSGRDATDGNMLAPSQPAERRVRRRLYFEDIEVRRSRLRGVACRVTLRKGDQSYAGEAEGTENERMRIELAARAALGAIRHAEGEDQAVALEGCKVVNAFDRQFVFVGVITRVGRDGVLTTGSAEIRDSAETASVLAVLDATNRWLDRAG